MYRAHWVHCLPLEVAGTAGHNGDKMRKPKLTAVELSKVLSRAAIGKLDHRFYGDSLFQRDVGLSDCGCVAGTAYDIGDAQAMYNPDVDTGRMCRISLAVSPGLGMGDYGGDPDSVLRHLEICGVA